MQQEEKQQHERSKINYVDENMKTSDVSGFTV